MKGDCLVRIAKSAMESDYYFDVGPSSAAKWFYEESKTLSRIVALTVDVYAIFLEAKEGRGAFPPQYILDWYDRFFGRLFFRLEFLYFDETQYQLLASMIEPSLKNEFSPLPGKLMKAISASKWEKGNRSKKSEHRKLLLSSFQTLRPALKKVSSKLDPDWNQDIYVNLLEALKLPVYQNGYRVRYINMKTNNVPQYKELLGLPQSQLMKMIAGEDSKLFICIFKGADFTSKPEQILLVKSIEGIVVIDDNYLKGRWDAFHLLSVLLQRALNREVRQIKFSREGLSHADRLSESNFENAVKYIQSCIKNKLLTGMTLKTKSALVRGIQERSLSFEVDRPVIGIALSK